MEDRSAFWFGTDYNERCPPSNRGIPQFNLECTDLDPTPTSMVERLFPSGSFGASTINSYLDVVIHEKPGRMTYILGRSRENYDSCFAI